MMDLMVPIQYLDVQKYMPGFPYWSEQKSSSFSFWAKRSLFTSF